MEPFTQAISDLAEQGKLPHRLTTSQLAALKNSLAKNAAESGTKLVEGVAKGFHDSLLSLLNPQQTQREEGKPTVTEGFNPATAREHINNLLKQYGAEGLMDSSRIDFALNIATKVAGGAGRFVQQNADQEVVDLYPALELLRVFDREVPRGFRSGKGGALIPVPDEDWPSRWAEAAEQCGDEDAAAVLESTGRMVALKSSPIWATLGNLRDDSLGNPFPPFAFNSGYDVESVSRAGAVELGLLEEGEKAEPAKVDFAKLFDFETAA